jgi:uncharacterized membrane protein
MRNQPGAPGYPEPDSPEQILARRFASGDITEEQYKRSLELLHSARSPRQYEPRG